MKVIHAPDISYAYRMGMLYLLDCGQWESTRNGKALVAPEPVTTVYLHPEQRVLFQPKRDANPFFHLFEALWMLAGRNDVAFLAQFVKRMASFSDNGQTFHGAYGHRWREWFGFDQLDWAVEKLRANPQDRQVIIAMWDPRVDPLAVTKDKPCNIDIKLEARQGRLDMSVFNRSNDIIWGCYGANVVHMSMLLEYLAARVGIPMGTYEQISTNFHAYESEWNKRFPLDTIPDHQYYKGQAKVFPLCGDPDTFDTELHMFLDEDLKGVLTAPAYNNQFLAQVAWPMYHAHALFKAGNVHSAIGLLDSAIVSSGPVDWLVSAREWIVRRAVAAGHPGAGT